MANKYLFCLLLFVALSFLPGKAVAQFSPGKNTGAATVMEYRKVKADTLKIRKSKQVQEKKRNVVVRSASGLKKKVNAKSGSLSGKRASASVKKSSKKVVKSKEEKIDSLYFEPIAYRLGDRVIMQGDSGADVRSVARILIKKLYFSEDSIIYTKNGVLYDGDLVRAVKHFQEFNGFYPDGIVTRELIKVLRKRK